MAGFFFRHFSLHQSQIKGRGLRAMRYRLARKRWANRRVKLSLKAVQTAVEEIKEQNRRIREESELMFVANILTDQWVYDCLIEVEKDPLMRNAFQRINAQNLDRRNRTNINQAQPFRYGGATAGDRRE
ncbi:hypothetical protein REPUB_Repub16aG0096800 [Reevesia pubescens]